MKSYEKYRDQEFVGVAELAKAVKDILESAETLPQGKDKIAQSPNERTIRYYLSEGLLPGAYYTEGTASVFTYRHLLTLLVIKQLQSQGLSIRIIRRIIANRNLTGLESLLTEEITATTDVDYARLAELRGEEVLVINDPVEIREVLEAPLNNFAGNATVEPVIWERYIISEDIELNISQNSELDKKGKRKLVREIKRLLTSNGLQ